MLLFLSCSKDNGTDGTASGTATIDVEAEFTRIVEGAGEFEPSRTSEEVIEEDETNEVINGRSGIVLPKPMTH